MFVLAVVSTGSVMSCDMVPPGKLVNSTTPDWPIPISEAIVGYNSMQQNLQQSAIVPLWWFFPRWCTTCSTLALQRPLPDFIVGTIMLDDNHFIGCGSVCGQHNVHNMNCSCNSIYGCAAAASGSALAHECHSWHMGERLEHIKLKTPHKIYSPEPIPTCLCLLMLCTVAFAVVALARVAADAALAVCGAAIVVAVHPLRSLHVIACFANTTIRIIIRTAINAVPNTNFDACSIKPLFNIILLLLVCLPTVFAAGSETPKVTMNEYFLPGVTRWDGIPYHDFRRIWWVALCAALGNINQEGWSLLQTARNQDLGSPGNPGTPNQTIQSDNRNQRLFGAILNYIEATSLIH